MQQAQQSPACAMCWLSARQGFRIMLRHGTVQLPRTGERGTPAVDHGDQQQSWNGSSSSILSKNYSVPHLHVCALVRLLSGQLRPHRLNRRGSLGACPASFCLDCLARCWLLVTEREKAEGFQTLLPSLLPICLLPAGQETPETLRNTHLPTCAPEGLQQGAGTVMNDHRGWSGQAGVETSLQRSKSQTADLAARPVTWFGIPALWL
jgi:hypothetical protein